MNQEQLNLYRKIFDEQFKNCWLNSYWRDIIQIYDKNDSWNREIATVVAFFPLMKITDMETNETVLKPCCSVAPNRYYWDMFIAMFMLYGNERYKYIKDVAADLCDGLDRMKVDADEIQNFDRLNIHNYLVMLRHENRKDNLFFLDPFELYKMLYLIEQSPEGIPDYLTPELREQHVKAVTEKMKPVFDAYFE